MRVIAYLKFLFVSFLVLGFAGCSGWRNQESDDLAKFLELSPYLPELGAFTRGRLHLDYSVLEAEFVLLSKDYDILDRLNHIAREEGWEVIEVRENVLILARPYRERESGFDQISFRIENGEIIALIWRKSSGPMPISRQPGKSIPHEAKSATDAVDGTEGEKAGDLLQTELWSYFLLNCPRRILPLLSTF